MKVLLLLVLLKHGTYAVPVALHALKWMEVKTMHYLERRVLKLMCGILTRLPRFGLQNHHLRIALAFSHQPGLHQQHSLVKMITGNLWLAPIIIRSYQPQKRFDSTRSRSCVRW